MSYHNITTNQKQNHWDDVINPKTLNNENEKKEEVPALNKEIITHQSIIKDGEFDKNNIVMEDPEKISVPRFRDINTQPDMNRVNVFSTDNVTPPQPQPMRLGIGQPLPIDNTNDRSLAQIFFNPLNMAVPEELQDNVDITSTTKYTVDDLELTLLGTFNTTRQQLRTIVKFPLDENIVIGVDQHIKHIYFLNKDGILDKYSLYGMDFSTLSLFLRKLFDIGNVYVHPDFNAIIHRIIMGRQNRIRYAIYEDELPKTEESNVFKLLKK